METKSSFGITLAFKKYLFFLTIQTISLASFSQSRNDTVVQIEKAMERYKPEHPGCQLSIERNGHVIFSKSWGMADLEHLVPLTLTSVIEAGSVSKQFTAAAILLLQQQGKLSLNDDVRKYIPELPDYGTPITLEQMMHHTSGLKDWGSIAALSGWPRTTKTYSNEDALEIIAAQKKLNNLPGAEFIYSNSNYNLLAIIVKRVSGQSLAEFSKATIFIPAGMTHTQWRDNHKRVVANRAIAYTLTKNGYETEMPNEDAYGNGGLLTTTEDLLKWNNFYLQGKLGTSSLLSFQTKVVPFNNGLMNDYGAGLFIQDFMGWKCISHSGATAGYRANLDVFPELKLSIAFLTNSSAFDTAKVSVIQAIRKIFIQSKDTNQATKNKEKIQSPTQLLFTHTGWYKNDRDGAGVRIKIKSKSILFDDEVLLPQTANQFKFATDDRVVNWTGKGFRLIIPQRDTMHYSKVDSTDYSTFSYKDFEGRYFSKETGSSITVDYKADKLLIHLKPGDDDQLKPTYKDGFLVSRLAGNLYFVRDRSNKVVSLYISIPRARNVEFVKQ